MKKDIPCKDCISLATCRTVLVHVMNKFIEEESNKDEEDKCSFEWNVYLLMYNHALDRCTPLLHEFGNKVRHPAEPEGTITQRLRYSNRVYNYLYDYIKEENNE